MLTLEDCIALSDLTHEEIDAIAEQSTCRLYLLPSLAAAWRTARAGAAWFAQ
jgi:hypothetical protein